MKNVLSNWKVVQTSPVATRGFGGLRSPNKAPSTPKLKYDTLQISGVFVKLYNVKPAAQT